MLNLLQVIEDVQDMPTGMRRMQLPTAALALSGVPARGAHEDRLKQTPQLERLVFGVLIGNI